MLSKTIIAVASLAATVAAAPSLVARTTGQQAGQQCGNNFKPKCCNSVQQSLLNLIPVQLGVNCVDIDVLSVLPITEQCSQTVACCTSGSQTGLINVNALNCPIILS